jgi:hypothetical protein
VHCFYKTCSLNPIPELNHQQHMDKSTFAVHAVKKIKLKINY